MLKRNTSDKKEANIGCVKKLPMERNVKRLTFEQMCQFRFSLCLCLLRFVCFCSVLQGFFLRLSFIQILVFVVLSFYHFEGSFHFWALLWGLVLRPFSTCSSVFNGVLPLSCGFFIFWLLLFFCSLLSRTSWGSVLLCATFSVFFFLGRIPPSSFLYWFCSQQFAELGSIHFLAFSARACSLACLCLAILFLGICRSLFWCTYFFY